MSAIDKIKESLGLGKPQVVKVPPTEIAKDQVELVAKLRRMEFTREWKCQCGATLKIRAKENREEGPSNFKPYPVGHRLAGHSQVESGLLTWNGLAAERGWDFRPAATCPACRVGLSVQKYKEERRRKERERLDRIEYERLKKKYEKG